ncbi:MAG: pantoate--beta-alanine ligase [Verrucomicrobia bacterium]|nr:pantoate--beta-alanine ligase [Verrucomicrobiota bacterium]
MEIIQSVSAMQAWSRAARAAGKLVGFVPTMGYLHEGHLSLMREAKRRAEVCVVSIYVNPTQFGPKEDFSKYPRDFERDRKLCESVGVDVIFAPTNEEMWGEGERRKTEDGMSGSTWVEETVVSERWEGTSRPGHFRGVCTVVAKLFNCVLPDVACFGQKDAQQCAVLRRMVRDLNFPLEFVVCPTVREPDGLAMSSRNVYLNPTERQEALALKQSLELARRDLAAGRTIDEVSAAMTTLIAGKPSARIDYIAFVDSETLLPVKRHEPGRTLVAMAVFVGKTRLIDNETF